MAKPEDAFLRFGCPRCLARLKARPPQAGRRQMCPRCQYMLVVPDAGQIAAASVRPEEYALRPAGEQAATQPGIVVDCPVCHTRSDASEEQVGQEMVCPDCGTVLVVQPPQAPAQREPPAVQVEGYALLDESHQPPESRSTTRPIQIPVRCPLCDTLMYGTQDQVGQPLLCPDCNTPVVVPPPAAAAAKPTHAVDDEYQLQEEVERPAATARPAKKPLIPVVCRVCEARMYAKPEQAGELICCPDCGTPVVVPQPKEATPRADAAATAATAAGEYRAGEAAERPEYHAPVNLRTARIEPGQQELVERSETVGIVRARPALPPRPMFSGVFTFPFYAGTWPRMVGLALGLLVWLPLIIFSLILMQAPNVGAASAVPWVGSMALMGMGGVLCVMWGVVASGLFLAVVQDTAEGADQIEDWPELLMFSDWALDFFFIFNSLAVTVLLGLAVAQILSFAGPVSWLTLPASVFFLFPIALVSMLEADSALKPFSLSVLGSLFSACWAWVLFYVEAAILVVAFAFLSGLVISMSGLWGLLLLGMLSVPLLMVYFRLLGRVALCCGQVAGEEDEPEREDDRAVGDEATTPPAAPPAPRERPPRAKSVLDDDWES